MGESRVAIPEERIVELCRRNHVRSLALSGSVLREGFSPNSDVNVLVEPEPWARVGFLALSRMALFGRPVDLVPRDGLKPMVREEVLYLRDIVEAADATARFLAAWTETVFCGSRSRLRRDAGRQPGVKRSNA